MKSGIEKFVGSFLGIKNRLSVPERLQRLKEQTVDI